MKVFNVNLARFFMLCLFIGSILINWHWKESVHNSTSFVFYFDELFNGITNSLVVLKSDDEIGVQKVKEIMLDESDETVENNQLPKTHDYYNHIKQLVEENGNSEELIESLEDFLADHGEHEHLKFSDEKILSTKYSSSDTIIMEDCGKNPCDFLFAHSGLSEEAIGKNLLSSI